MSTTMSDFFRQLGYVFVLFLRLLSTRTSSALVSLVSFAVVSGVLMSVLMLAVGVSKLWTPSSANDVALIVSQNAFAEINSQVSPTAVGRIQQAPGLDRSLKQALSPELLATITLPRSSDGQGQNVVLRGLVHRVDGVHANMKLVAGRMFHLGVDEIVVGKKLTETLRGVDIGNEVVIGDHPFKVVGIFSADGDITESEIWGDASQFGDALRTPGKLSVIYAKLNSQQSLDSLKAYLGNVPGLGVKAYLVSDYVRRQAAQYIRLVLFPGLLVVLIMAIAAVFAAVNTMQSSIRARLRDIATLRALGFYPVAVVIALILESIVLGLVSGCVGIVITTVCFQNATAITSNGLSAFAVTMTVGPAVIVLTAVFAIGIGLLGGIWPAIRASRVSVANALRTT